MLPLDVVFSKTDRAMVCEKLPKLFNRCLDEGISPDSLKVANVCLIYTTSDSLGFGNYTQISLLSVIGRGDEKLFRI